VDKSHYTSVGAKSNGYANCDFIDSTLLLIDSSKSCDRMPIFHKNQSPSTERFTNQPKKRLSNQLQRTANNGPHRVLSIGEDQIHQSKFERQCCPRNHTILSPVQIKTPGILISLFSSFPTLFPDPADGEWIPFPAIFIVPIILILCFYICIPSSSCLS